VASGLFESGDLPPDDEAAPDLSFSVAKLRSLWAVALFDRPAPAAATLAYQCKVTGAKNVVIADGGAQSLAIAATDGVVVLRQRLVVLAKQKWIPGKHTLTCMAGTATLLRLSFDLTK